MKPQLTASKEPRLPKIFPFFAASRRNCGLGSLLLALKLVSGNLVDRPFFFLLAGEKDDKFLKEAFRDEECKKSRSMDMWLINLGSEPTLLYSWTICSASIFVFVALVLSMYLIFEHLAAYNQPEEQKFLIGLILMVPVYALESFLSLLYSSAAFNYEVIRDCYEALALYCFERYLIACLGGEANTIEYMESQSLVTTSIPLLEESYAYGVVEHPFPLNCLLRDWHLGSDFYQAVKIGIVQYMILKMICAVLAMVFESFGVYGEGQFKWKFAYPYLAVVLNFSQTWALYCLVQFYSVTKIAFLFSMGVFRGALAQELKTRIQDYIICIEMGVAAVVHLYVFPAVPYKRGERCVRNVAVMTDYASLGTPPDPEEVQDCERSTRISLARHVEREKRLNFPQSVRDVVVGSGEIIVDDMKFTVSHVVEPVERGIATINKTFHQISENVKRFEERRKNSKDDSYLIPLNTWTKEFSEVHDNLVEGSVSDSGLPEGKRPHHHTKATSSRFR
ncbi:protein LAZ1 homolog 1 isoform X4 [Rhododendron vialii]|uniref:protein LAZ1 homolog 1 isoform X4 n=1 Tax=Rhododendron vialii TaxID=182163 RepID=UPI00265D6339|nr:protein LAZ1 homolog 1 isoform X4 [Rhododendron vialii]